MTFYELIRASLLKDAEGHPYPLKGCDPVPPDNGGAERENMISKRIRSGFGGQLRQSGCIGTGTVV